MSAVVSMLVLVSLAGCGGSGSASSAGGTVADSGSGAGAVSSGGSTADGSTAGASPAAGSPAGQTPTGTVAPGGSATTGVAKLSWNVSQEGAAGYKVYYGTSSGSYGNVVDVGLVQGYEVSLPAGTYYFVVTAYDATGYESPRSNEASKTIN